MSPKEFQTAILNALMAYTAEEVSGDKGRKLRVDVEATVADDVKIAATNGDDIETNGAGALKVVLPDGAQTITSSAATSSGSVTAGATMVNFRTSSDFVGSINGAARPQGAPFPFEAQQGKTLPAIAYVVTAGTLYIDRIA